MWRFQLLSLEGIEPVLCLLQPRLLNNAQGMEIKNRCFCLLGATPISSRPGQLLEDFLTMQS
jgi:hypothetical protein